MKKMAQQYRNLSLGIIGIVVLTGFVSCMTSGEYDAVPGSKEAEQVALIKLYVPGPDEKVKTLDIFLEYRKNLRKNGCDIIADFNAYKKYRVWYNEHQDKIVSIKIVKYTQFYGGNWYWRVQYVD